MMRKIPSSIKRAACCLILCLFIATPLKRASCDIVQNSNIKDAPYDTAVYPYEITLFPGSFDYPVFLLTFSKEPLPGPSENIGITALSKDSSYFTRVNTTSFNGRIRPNPRPRPRPWPRPWPWPKPWPWPEVPEPFWTPFFVLMSIYAALRLNRDL